MTRLTGPLRWWFMFGVTVVALGVGVTAAVIRSSHPATRVLGEKITGSGSSSGTKGNGNGTNGNGNGGKPFTISGTVAGLYPGADEPLALTFSNPNGSTITVDSLTVRPADAAVGCPGTLLTFDGFRQTPVPGKGSATLTLTTHMSSDAPNACSDVSWTLDYTATAVQK